MSTSPTEPLPSPVQPVAVKSSRLRRMPVSMPAPRAPNITGLLVFALGAIVLLVVREMKKLSSQVDRLRRIVGPAIDSGNEPEPPPPQSRPDISSMFGASFPAEFFGRRVPRENPSFARIEEESDEDEDEDEDVDAGPGTAEEIPSPAAKEQVTAKDSVPAETPGHSKKKSRRGGKSSSSEREAE